MIESTLSPADGEDFYVFLIELCYLPKEIRLVEILFLTKSGFDGSLSSDDNGSST